MEYYEKLPQINFWLEYVQRSLLLGEKITVLKNNVQKIKKFPATVWP